MEKRDLYNENKELINKTIDKDEAIPEGSYILMVVAFIQNKNNEFLIQKRSQEKGGEWAFTGGHPKAGETSLEGMKTELKEELGLFIEDLTLFKEAKGKNTFCDLYYVKQDIDLNTITIQKEEVAEVKFATKKEIDEMLKSGIFKKGHYMMFQDCLKYLENK